MAGDVFANNREIASKAGGGTVICAFPDVCFTPPQTPPTPPGVPIPYPNTGKDNDTTKGSKKTKIKDKEIVLKNQSFFKTSYGDEAGCAPKKGVITSNNRGKVYFQMWSMDVKAEGKNLPRMGDMTTNNHRSTPGDTPPWVFVKTVSAGMTDPCHKDKKKEQKACAEFKPNGDRDACEEAGLGVEGASSGSADYVSRPRSHTTAKPKLDQRRAAKEADRCISARRCSLQPYKKTKRGEGGCCPAQTGNHVIPASYFSGVAGYDHGAAPTMCVTGCSWHSGNHQYAHTAQSVLDGATAAKNGNGKVSIAQAAKNGATATRALFPESGCRKGCIEAQIKQGHQEMGLGPNTEVTYKPIADSADLQWRTIAEVSEKMQFYRGR